MSSAGLVLGNAIDVMQDGTGALTLTPDAGITFVPSGSQTLRAEGAGASAIYLGSSRFWIIGDLVTAAGSFDPLNLANNAAPGTPGAGILRVFGRSFANRMMPSVVGPDGAAAMLQQSLARGGLSFWSPAGNSTTITAVGAAALTATGTATAVNVATTNRHTRQKRLEYLVTVAATTAVAGFRAAAAQWTIGAAAAGDGGFTSVMRWGPATGVATTTSRAFCGMSSSTSAPTDVEPSTITNSIGMGWDAADTNIQLMYRGAGAANKIDLGASFPVPTADRTAIYEIALYAKSGTIQSVGYLVTDITSGATASGTITTNLPAVGTFLAPRGWMSVGGTSSVIGIALMNAYMDCEIQ